MRASSAVSRSLAILGLAATLQVAAPAPAGAGVFSDSPTLPLLGVPYASSVGAGCFPLAGVCIAAGSLVLDSLIASSFSAAGQDILTTATYTGSLTTLLGVGVGSVVLTGTVEQAVLGRTTSSDTGSWATELVAMSLTGPVLGSTLSLALDPAHDSTGVSSITPSGAGQEGYLIDSFFDVFVALRLDSTPPLATERGPLRFEVVPEPASVALLALGLAGLLALQHHGRASPRRIAAR